MPRLLGALAVVALAGLGLMATNPNEEEFERFASERVTEAALQEICHEQGLPLLARLVVRDCPRLIESQRGLLGKLARAASQRRNFGLFSLYRTDLGGQRLLPDWALPRYRALTLAGAGRFVILRSSQEEVDGAELAR